MEYIGICQRNGALEPDCASAGAKTFSRHGSFPIQV